MKEGAGLLVVAGHSGGHILPALELARHWLRGRDSEKVDFITTTKQLDRNLLTSSSLDLRHHPLPVASMPTSIWSYLTFPPRLVYSFCYVLSLLIRQKPQKVIATGGLISIPVCLAARALGLPVEVYELNAVPGRATRFLSKFDVRLYCVFEEAAARFLEARCKAKIIRAPYPLRSMLMSSEERSFLTHKSVRLFTNDGGNVSCADDRVNFFILGGSQASSYLSDVFLAWIKSHPEMHSGLQVVHQTKASLCEDVRSFYQSHDIPAYVFSYENDVSLFYRFADITLTRAGAGTLFELAHFKTKAIIVPLETSTSDHQVSNAVAMTKRHPDLFVHLMQRPIEEMVVALDEHVPRLASASFIKNCIFGQRQRQSTGSHT